MQVGKVEYAPNYGKWLDDASPTGRRLRPMEVVGLAGHSPTDAAARVIAQGRPALPAEPIHPRRDPWEQWRQPPANDNWPRVVAFTGLAGSGKSTAADYLVARGYQRVKFAGPLKDMCRVVGLTEDQIEGSTKETPTRLLQGKTPRQFMQLLGTEFGRDLIGRDFWTFLWQHAALQIIDNGGRVVCDDCRFSNEAEVVRGVGGVVVRLEGRGGISGGHASERMEFAPDFLVPNDGDRLELESGIDRTLRVAA